MLFSNCTVRFLSKNLSSRTLTVRHCRKNSLSPLSLMTKEYCMCSASSRTIKLGHSVIPLTQRCFVSTTNPLCKKARSRNEDDEDIEEEYEALGSDKIIKTRLTSDRLDTVLKAGLKMSRNKIEKAFFADRIRINGVRPNKKSQMVEEGDEVDVIRKYNTKNPEFLDISRVEILKMEDGYSRLEDEDSDDEAKKAATLRTSKILTVENYTPPYKGNLNDE